MDDHYFRAQLDSIGLKMVSLVTKQVCLWSTFSMKVPLTVQNSCDVVAINKDGKEETILLLEPESSFREIAILYNIPRPLLFMFLNFAGSYDSVSSPSQTYCRFVFLMEEKN